MECIVLLRQILQQTSSSPNYLFRDPFKDLGSEQLVKEVVALANTDVRGPRYIVFGVNLGGMDGKKLVGISEDFLVHLKKAHALVSALVDPLLHLAFIYDKIDGKLVGAIEVDGCHNAPYTIKRNSPEGLSAGEAWVREGRSLRSLTDADKEQIRIRTAQRETWEVAVGFGDETDCDRLRLDVPDRSDPPSVKAKQSVKNTLDWKKKAQEAIGTINTCMMRLMHVRDHGTSEDFDERGVETLIDVFEEIGNDLKDADNHYFFEEKALKANLTICNQGNDYIRDASIELVLPRAKDFGIADRIYHDPDDDELPIPSGMRVYPEVRCIKNAYVVRATLGDLAPNQPLRAFKHALRLVVGPKMEGKKVAIRYVLRSPSKGGSCQGRLKIEFRRASAPIKLELQNTEIEGNNPYNTA